MIASLGHCLFMFTIYDCLSAPLFIYVHYLFVCQFTFVFWCNGPVGNRSFCLQADVGTSGRIVDDDALSFRGTSDAAVVAGSHSSQSVVTRG